MSEAGLESCLAMEIIAQSGTSDNTSNSGYNQLSDQQKEDPRLLQLVEGGTNGLSDDPLGPASDFDAGYSLLEPHEIDPNPGELPPDLRDGMQAALHAQLRGFDVLQLQPDGTQVAPDNAATNDPAIIRERWAGAPRCKVGGVTDGLVVLALGDQYRTLAAITNTAAVASHIHKTIFLFFRLPAGVRSVEGGVAAGVDIISSDGYVALPSGSITDGCRWVKRYAIATAPQWLVDKLAALAASQSQTEGNEVMGAGATAVELFRKGQLPGTGAPPIIADEPELGAGEVSAVLGEEDPRDKEDKKDTSEIAQQAAPAKPAPAANPQPIKPAVAERETRADASPANSPRYDEAFDWILSDDSPEVTDANVREVLPKIAAELCRRFDVSLTETVELTRIVAEDCDKPPTPAEIEQIVKLAYSPDRASASGVTAKPYSSKLEAALDHARRGFRVLPLIPNGKESVIKEWQYAATSDKERICRWFKENPTTISQ